MSDKRRCHRLDVDLPASFKFSPEGKDLFLVTVVDVSGLGVRISTNEQLEAGQELVLQMITDANQKINMLTTVAWVEPKELHLRQEFFVGLRISEAMGMDEHQFIEFFSKKFLESRKRID